MNFSIDKIKCSTANVKIKKETLNEDEQLIQFKDEFKTAPEVEHQKAQDVIQIKKEPTNEYNENVNVKMAENEITNTLEAIQNTDEIKIENETINECVVASPDVFEIIEPALPIHLQPQSQDPVTSFSCEFCGHTLPTKNGIYKHCLRKHKNERGLCSQSSQISLVCPLCSKKFRTVTSLKTHIVEKHSDKGFICEHCGHNLPTKNALCQHRLRKHRDIERLQINNTKLKFTCPSCAESFTTAKNLKLHKVRAHMHIKKKSNTTEEKKTCLQCEDCGHKLPTRNALYQHRLRKHRNKKNIKIYHSCAYCEIILPSSERLQSHLQASHGALPALKQLVDSL